MADAPRPWTARAAIRTPSAGAAAQAAEPAAKAARPTVNTFLAPTRSAVDPAVRVRVHHPLQSGQRAADLTLDGGQRHVHDRDIKLDHEKAQADGDERGGRPAAADRSRRG